MACHLRATCHIAGCCSRAHSIRHVENRFCHIFLKCNLGFDERRLSYRLRYTCFRKPVKTSVSVYAKSHYQLDSIQREHTSTNASNLNQKWSGIPGLIRIRLRLSAECSGFIPLLALAVSPSFVKSGGWLYENILTFLNPLTCPILQCWRKWKSDPKAVSAES